MFDGDGLTAENVQCRQSIFYSLSVR